MLKPTRISTKNIGTTFYKQSTLLSSQTTNHTPTRITTNHHDPSQRRSHQPSPRKSGNSSNLPDPKPARNPNPEQPPEAPHTQQDTTQQSSPEKEKRPHQNRINSRTCQNKSPAPRGDKKRLYTHVNNHSNSKPRETHHTPNKPGIPGILPARRLPRSPEPQLDTR